jgi:hypothetical protein
VNLSRTSGGYGEYREPSWKLGRWRRQVSTMEIVSHDGALLPSDVYARLGDCQLAREQEVPIDWTRRTSHRMTTQCRSNDYGSGLAHEVSSDCTCRELPNWW